MEYIYTFFLLPMLIIFAFSALVGAVMFCVDIVKWSKRPEKFEDIRKDLDTSMDESVKAPIHESKSDDDDMF